jgi:hypothetical protein
MYLSKDFLETVKYCEVRIESQFHPVTTQFKFHFKKWYKMSLTISMEWQQIEAPYPGHWRQSTAIANRKQQLEEYFKII